MRESMQLLLRNISSRREIDFYLKRFADVDANRFAVVKVGGKTLADELDVLASSLALLARMGLTPIVVHGAGEQVDAALAAEGVKSDRRDGLRVTTPDVLHLARRVFMRENRRLVDALQENGVAAESVAAGVFEAELLDEARYGMVGKVGSVHLEHVNHCLRRGTIPVISPLGESREGRILNINADVATNELVHVIQPFKIVFLTPTGGILDSAGNVIPSVNLITDFDRLMDEPWLHSGMRLKLEQINSLLLKLPRSSSVSITRPGMLAKELFTYRGSGTLVRIGERIEKHVSWHTVDCRRLRDLLECSFGRGLVADYFEKTPLEGLYISENYKAVAIVVADGAIARLDKFAVTEKARGEGLAKAVWTQVRDNHDRLYWRANPDNPVNEFYFGRADGCIRGEDWNVYWYGLSGFEQIESCVRDAPGGAVTLD